MLDLEIDFLRENAYAYFCGYLYLEFFTSSTALQHRLGVGQILFDNKFKINRKNKNFLFN